MPVPPLCTSRVRDGGSGGPSCKPLPTASQPAHCCHAIPLLTQFGMCTSRWRWQPWSAAARRWHCSWSRTCTSGFRRGHAAAASRCAAGAAWVENLGPRLAAVAALALCLSCAAQPAADRLAGRWQRCCAWARASRRRAEGVRLTLCHQCRLAPQPVLRCFAISHGRGFELTRQLAFLPSYWPHWFCCVLISVSLQSEHPLPTGHVL